MDASAFQAQLTEIAEELDVPGVAAGIYHDGTEEFAYHGVTSVDNPLPVDENTLFQYGSTHKTFTATAMKELIYEPLQLEHTFFFPNDVMTRRFVVGHRQDPDGTIKVARPWALSRAGAPAGGFGVSANAGDQIKWARFHLGDGQPLLSKETLDLMKQPTAEMPGSALGDAVGISWLLRDVGGVLEVGHGGTTIGQYSQFRMFPERDFALVSMTNCGPNGSQLNRRLGEWALEAFFGITVPEDEQVELGADALAAYAGTYETASAWAAITA